VLPSRSLFQAAPEQGPDGAAGPTGDVLLPAGLELPSLPPRGFSFGEESQRRVLRPLLQEQGRDSGLASGEAAVELVHAGDEVITVWAITPSRADTLGPLLLALAPGQTERLVLPAGEYQLSRLFRLDAATGIERKDEHPPQTLRAGFLYRDLVTSEVEDLVREQERWRLRRAPIRQRLELR
jgi:hypothetical protein